MDEKEFLNVSSNDILVDEKINLSKNLSKIDKVINYNIKKMNKGEKEANNYKGDHHTYEAFLTAKNNAAFYRKKINNLKETEESPYHMHIYLEEKEHDEDMYIGLNDVSDVHGNIIVYSIWSDIAKAFSDDIKCLNYKGINYKLRFKRKITIENKEIIDLVEEYNSHSGKNEQVTDYFLRNILREKKNVSGFTDIVKTIQKKQNDIIRADINKNIICQGVAGSGKTAIIVHRLSNLLYNNPNIPAERYLFIAPNSNFKSELSNLNKKLKIDKIKLSTLYEYYIEKINSIFEDNFGVQQKYEIKKIVDDYNIDISSSYSKSYFEKKYNMFVEEIYKDIKEIMEYYSFNPKYNISFRENMKELRKIINYSMASFNEKKSEIIKTFKDIIDLSKKTGQTAGNVDDINDFESIINNHEKRTKKIINDYELLLTNTENELIKRRKKIDYDFYSKYNFSIDDIEEDLNKFKERKNNLEIQTSKIEKSLLSVSQSPIIENNKKIINELNEDIKNLEKKYEYMNSDEFEYELDKYNNLEKNLNKYSNAILCLNESNDLCSNVLSSSNAYKKLTITNDISHDQTISYNRVLKNLLNYICLNAEKASIDSIKQINELLVKSININSSLDYNSFIMDKDYLNKLSENIKASVLIKRSFSLILNDKYSFTIDGIKNSSFSRNDIVLLLYIYNQLGLSKRKMFDYLFIDEAQDYNDIEISLIKKLELNPIMNIFGDYQQNISKNSLTRNNWNNLKKELNNNSWYCELNENYRNTMAVVDYCNNNLNTKMTKIGIEGNPVIEKESVNISDLINFCKHKNYQIIVNDEDIIKKIKKIDSNIKCNSVLDVKGLEFENVIVINNNLDDNNKYVAYTRTKNDLIVINKILDDENKINLEDNCETIVANDEGTDLLELYNQTEKENIDVSSDKQNNEIINDLIYNDNNSNIIDDNLENEIIQVIQDVDDYKKNANELFKFYNIEKISNNLNNRIRARLIMNGLINNPKIEVLSFEEKIKVIIDILNDVKYISDSEFINILFYYSDDIDERDKIYEAIISLGFVILEDD